MNRPIIVDDAFAINCLRSDKSHWVHILTHVDVDDWKDLRNFVSTSSRCILTSKCIASFLENDNHFNNCKAIPFNTPNTFTIRGKQYCLYFFDSKHSAGSLGVLIEGDFGTALFMGNFWYHRQFWKLPFIKQFRSSSPNKVLNTLYVDSGFDQLCDINGLGANIRRVIEVVKSYNGRRILIAAERFYMDPVICEIASKLKEKFYISQTRLKIMNNLGYSDFFTNDPTQARVYIMDSFVDIRPYDSDLKIILRRRAKLEYEYLKEQHDIPTNLYVFNFYPFNTYFEYYKIIVKLKPKRVVNLQSPPFDHQRPKCLSFASFQNSTQLTNISNLSRYQVITNEPSCSGEPPQKKMKLSLPECEKPLIRVRTPAEVNAFLEKNYVHKGSAQSNKASCSKDHNAQILQHKSAISNEASSSKTTHQVEESQLRSAISNKASSSKITHQAEESQHRSAISNKASSSKTTHQAEESQHRSAISNKASSSKTTHQAEESQHKRDEEPKNQNKKNLIYNTHSSNTVAGPSTSRQNLKRDVTISKPRRSPRLPPHLKVAKNRDDNFKLHSMVRRSMTAPTNTVHVIKEEEDDYNAVKPNEKNKTPHIMVRRSMSKVRTVKEEVDDNATLEPSGQYKQRQQQTIRRPFRTFGRVPKPLLIKEEDEDWKPTFARKEKEVDQIKHQMTRRSMTAPRNSEREREEDMSSNGRDQQQNNQRMHHTNTTQRLKNMGGKNMGEVSSVPPNEPFYLKQVFRFPATTMDCLGRSA